MPCQLSVSAPQLQEDSEQAEQLATSRVSRLKGLTVLLVDDDDDARDLAATVLGHHGADVQKAASAPEALLRLRERRPDVIVSDLAMPGQDGFSLIKQVRAGAVPGAANVPAAALTAYARDTDARKAIGAGFQLHATKPIAPSDLIELVVTLSGRYR